MIQVQGQAVC